MLRILIGLLTVITALGAADPWAKVRELKGGAELRIYKKGGKQPLLAKMDEASEESLIVVLKNEQVAIARDEIDRIDYRPAQPGGRLKKETKTTVEGPDTKAMRSGPTQGFPGPSSSTSTSLTVQSKPDFETLYRRPITVPQK